MDRWWVYGNCTAYQLTQSLPIHKRNTSQQRNRVTVAILSLHVYVQWTQHRSCRCRMQVPTCTHKYIYMYMWGATAHSITLCNATSYDNYSHKVFSKTKIKSHINSQLDTNMGTIVVLIVIDTIFLSPLPTP